MRKILIAFAVLAAILLAALLIFSPKPSQSSVQFKSSNPAPAVSLDRQPSPVAIDQETETRAEYWFEEDGDIVFCLEWHGDECISEFEPDDMLEAKHRNATKGVPSTKITTASVSAKSTAHQKSPPSPAESASKTQQPAVRAKNPPQDAAEPAPNANGLSEESLALGTAAAATGAAAMSKAVVTRKISPNSTVSKPQTTNASAFQGKAARPTPAKSTRPATERPAMKASPIQTRSKTRNFRTSGAKYRKK